MKPWPEAPWKLAADPVTPVRKAYGRLMRGKPAAYDGYDIADSEKTTSLGSERLFKRMEGDREEMLDRVLWFLFQLGIEQGRRDHRRWMLPFLRRLIMDASNAGADVEWAREQWAEETGGPWPGSAEDVTQQETARRKLAEMMKGDEK